MRPVADTLLERLKAANADHWRAYVEHPFVRALGSGTLPRASFEHYLRQDYVFLIHFARAFGLAAFKSRDLEELRAAKSSIHDTDLKRDTTCPKQAITPRRKTATITPLSHGFAVKMGAMAGTASHAPIPTSTRTPTIQTICRTGCENGVSDFRSRRAMVACVPPPSFGALCQMPSPVTRASQATAAVLLHPRYAARTKATRRSMSASAMPFSVRARAV